MTGPLSGAGMGDQPLVARLGFGCARVFGGIEVRHSRRLLEQAYALGIRHYDTAPIYGHGQSEDVLGEVFGHVADVTVTTKIGLPRPTGNPSLAQAIKRLTVRRMLSRAPGLKRRLMRGAGAVGSEPHTVRTLDRDTILRGIDDSCRRLRRETIDAYLIHEPDQFVLDADLHAVFEDLKAQGRIGGHGLAYGRAAPEPAPGWDIIQSRLTTPDEEDRSVRLYHGVLRTAEADGPGRLRAVLEAQPRAMVLVSASEPHQLVDLGRRLGSHG